ncbi:hypothetical protein OEZ86_009635 [Tetradesmus obliquus]|uniref:ABC transmembrane type-1 domain-containing protein n=1 Tax=Tetradesmus obliquus TaxID=3088 RepID=A0ABY8UQV8_TETOB|nr:hypothetical protein OEZ85_001078 [Tetradesmus obliquus]WIA43118.1 hypothetical protein OEZ86_009635 [Tetradesmus obliquus]
MMDMLLHAVEYLPRGIGLLLHDRLFSVEPAAATYTVLVLAVFVLAGCLPVARLLAACMLALIKFPMRHVQWQMRRLNLRMTEPQPREESAKVLQRVVAPSCSELDMLKLMALATGTPTHHVSPGNADGCILMEGILQKRGFGQEALSAIYRGIRAARASQKTPISSFIFAGLGKAAKSARCWRAWT